MSIVIVNISSINYLPILVLSKLTFPEDLKHWLYRNIEHTETSTKLANDIHWGTLNSNCAETLTILILTALKIKLVLIQGSNFGMWAFKIFISRISNSVKHQHSISEMMKCISHIVYIMSNADHMAWLCTCIQFDPES